MYTIETPTGKKLQPPKGRCWGATEPVFDKYRSEGRVYFPKGGNGRPRIKAYVGEEEGLVPSTIWFAKDVGDNERAKKEVLALFPDDEAFDTPKPEHLMQSILSIATNPGDLVLDSFLGSGTTAAVAMKMRRQFIGVEMGSHADTVAGKRLQRVIEGEAGGISKSADWQGGSGFRFCTLGEPAFDEHGRINPEVRFATLAAYVWHIETGKPGEHALDKPLLGVHDGTAYFLLYNGILGDRRPAGGNVLTNALLQALNHDFPHAGPKVIYGESSRLGAARLAAEGITFKQIPYDVKMR